MSGATYFAGIDVGSATTKVVLLDGAGRLVSRCVIPSGGNLSKATDRALAGALAEASADAGDVAATISTGYGRDSVASKTKAVTEITCHARGANALNSAVRSVIDIGGQDSKAISLTEAGRVRKFEMNDKCAAGTGRFLEVMGRTLEVDLAEMGRVALTADRTVKISSTCTVFAESEVISLLAQGESIACILASLCDAIAQRVNSLASRVGMAPDVMMTGGVAKNQAVVRSIERIIGLPVIVPDEPQIVGALGAAILAREMMETASAPQREDESRV